MIGVCPYMSFTLTSIPSTSKVEDLSKVVAEVEITDENVTLLPPQFLLRKLPSLHLPPAFLHLSSVEAAIVLLLLPFWKQQVVQR